ncbi:MAG: MaoC family dehydratase [Hyphomicrobiales bacterium]|nr:MaoC family dehydratase [Hyphomicrobiales bacterium]
MKSFDRAELWFEDFEKGNTVPLADYEISREEIIDFAVRFDPQPIHTDEDAARETIVEGLCASGWHTCAIFMRMMCGGFLLNAKGLGSPGVDNAKWIRPVRAGDRLSGSGTVESARASTSRPEIGICVIAYRVKNQHGEDVFAIDCRHIFARRNEESAS